MQILFDPLPNDKLVVHHTDAPLRTKLTVRLSLSYITSTQIHHYLRTIHSSELSPQSSLALLPFPVTARKSRSIMILGVRSRAIGTEPDLP